MRSGKIGMDNQMILYYCPACGVSYAAAFPMTYCPECGRVFDQAKGIEYESSTTNNKSDL